MRDCPGLIDSLMAYIQSCVAEKNPDDPVRRSMRRHSNHKLLYPRHLLHYDSFLCFDKKAANMF